MVAAGSLRKNFRNFRKRSANQGGGRNTGHRRKPVRGFRSFRKRSANCGGVDVPAQRQAAGAVRPARQPASRPRRSSGFCRQRVVRRTWRCSSTWFRSPCKPYPADSQVFLKLIKCGSFCAPCRAETRLGVSQSLHIGNNAPLHTLLRCHARLRAEKIMLSITLNNAAHERYNQDRPNPGLGHPRHLRRRDRARYADGLWQRHGRRSGSVKTDPVDFASDDRLVKKLRFSQSAALQEQYSRTCEAPSICPGGRR